MSNTMRIVQLFLLLAGFLVPDSSFSQEQLAKPPFPQLNEARKNGWQLASLVLDALEAGDNSKWPATGAWLKDIRTATKGIDLKISPDKWPALDIDALVAKNPKFWNAYYELAPGDPGAILLYAGLLLTAGECDRASTIVLLGGQRPGVPEQIQTGFKILRSQSAAVKNKANDLVLEGIKLYDKGDFEAALSKHREALKKWPANGFAAYELGLTQRELDWAKSGKKDQEFSKEVVEAFASARRHDPWQLKAYQGSDKEVIAGFIALGRKGLPAWSQIIEKPNSQVKDKVLVDLCEALQEAQQHELALVCKQVIVARRGRFLPEDHPFIKMSLKKLASGEGTDAALTRLAGERALFRQIVKPEEP